MELFFSISFVFVILNRPVFAENVTSCTTEKRCKCSRNNEYLLVANCSGFGLSSVPIFNKKVRIIDLSNNMLSSLPQREAIPATILYLNLSGNSLQSLNNRAFKDMLNLKWLDISNNFLHYNSTVFGMHLFRYMKQLQYINMKNNADVSKNVHTYPVALSELTALEQLLIDGVDTAGFPEQFLSLENLDLLDLSGHFGRCNIKTLQSTFFQYLSTLKFVDFSRCHLRYIESGTFRNLTFMRTLDLSYNYRLTFKMLENITYDIQFTNLSILLLKRIHCTFGVGTILFEKDIKYLSNSSIKEIHLDSNRLETVQIEAIRHLKTVRVLSLSYNKFTIGKFLLAGNFLKNLEVIDVSYQQQTHRHPADIFEDCNDWRGPENTNCNSNPANNSFQQSSIRFFPFTLPPKLKSIDGSSSSFKTTIVKLIFSKNNSVTHVYLQNNSFYFWDGPLRNLHRLEYLDLSYNLCNNITTYFFSDFPALKVLNISNNNLGFVLNRDKEGKIFENLHNLQFIDLSNNNIFIIPALTFRNMRNLKNLILHHNLLKQWEVKMPNMESLRILDISFNEVSVLDKRQRNAITLLTKMNNFTMNLTGNTLRCICESLNFLRWLDNNRKTFPNFEQYMCALYNGSFVHMDKSPSLLLKKHCETYIGLVSGILAAIVLSVSIVTSGLVYRYRWKLRYIYYVTKSKYKLPSNQTDRDLSKEYYYDAFVTYANEDQTFVTELFLKNIENAGLTICLHQRDFIAGNDIAENITNAIQRSRRIIVILTRHYLKSYWCMFEFNMARMESIYTRGGKNVVLMILYKKVAPSDIPLSMLYMIEQQSYLEYPEDEQGQTLFWNKLKEAISRE